MDFDGDGNLIVADAYKGLLSVSPQGEVTVLAAEHAGVPFRLTDDVDVAADGTIYFSDASSKFSVADSRLDFLEHWPNGRLLSYDPATGETTLLLDKLYFANGVAVSPDGSFVLVVETAKYRIQRYWLMGERAGESEIFIDNLPGFPDGVSSNGRETFWVALYSPRVPSLDRLLPHPFWRKVIARLPGWLQPAPLHHGFVLGLDPEGNVIHNLQDASPDAYAPVTSVEEWGGALYLGSLTAPAIGRLPAPR